MTSAELPVGCTHPYLATGPAATVYRHRMTFTWTRGDSYVAVQRGRVANARRVKIIEDSHPGQPILLGRRPVVDWLPAPPPDEWRRDVMRELADHWLATQRAAIQRGFWDVQVPFGTPAPRHAQSTNQRSD